MKMVPRAALALDVLTAKIFQRNAPLVITWAITYHCNRRCSYCCRWDSQANEMSIAEAKSVLCKLCHLGLKRINFSGGEPLLKEGFFDLIALARQKDVFIAVNTNGSVVPQNSGDLKAIDLLNLSVEGNAEVNDFIRGEGSYEEIMRAAETARKKNVKFRFSATLNKYNQNNLLDLIRLAKEFDTMVSFQVLEHYRLGSNIENPDRLEDSELRSSIKRLVEYKSDSKLRKNIGNSMNGLKYLLAWPDLKKMQCIFGQIAYRVEPEGILRTCLKQKSCKYYEIDLKNKNANEILENFNSFKREKPNCACGCVGLVEANLIWNANLKSIFEIIRF